MDCGFKSPAASWKNAVFNTSTFELPTDLVMSGAVFSDFRRTEWIAPDGQLVRTMRVSDVSVAPIPDETFNTSVVPD